MWYSLLVVHWWHRISILPIKLSDSRSNIDAHTWNNACLSQLMISDVDFRHSPACQNSSKDATLD